MEDTNHPSQDALVQSLTQKISGFRPEMTGGLCDTCNIGLSEGDIVYVYADYYNGGNWRLFRTACSDCGDALDDRSRVEAIVRCELGQSPNNGQSYPLYNPKVVELNTSDGAAIRN